MKKYLLITVGFSRLAMGNIFSCNYLFNPFERPPPLLVGSLREVDLSPLGKDKIEVTHVGTPVNEVWPSTQPRLLPKEGSRAAQLFPGYGYFSFNPKSGLMKDSDGNDWYVSQYDSPMTRYTRQSPDQKMIREDFPSKFIDDKVILKRVNSSEYLILRPRDYVESNTYQTHSYNLSFTTHGERHNITVQAAEMYPGHDVSREVEQVREALGSLPPFLAKLIHQVELANFSKQTTGIARKIQKLIGTGTDFGRNKASVPLWGRSIMFHPHSSLEDLKDSLRHEVGHLINTDAFGIFKLTPPGWEKTMTKNGLSVSPYGDTSPGEDFAESVRIYLGSLGGATDPKLRQKYLPRFQHLDEILHSRDGKLADGGYWREYQFYRGRQVFRVAVVVVAAGVFYLTDPL